MNSPTDNKYEKIEQDIDKILSEDKIYVFPPGFTIFLIVNLLLLFSAASLIITIQDVLFTNIKTAMVFTVTSELIMAIVVVVPPALIIWGYRNAFVYLKFLVITLTILMSIFTIIETFTNGKFLPLSFAGLVCLVIVYFMINSPTYVVFRLFTARRRELAVKKKAGVKEIIGK